MDEKPTLPPPLYAPDVVARAILRCAETPERDVTVGFGGKAIVLTGHYAPRTSDRVMEATLPEAQKKEESPRDPANALHGPTTGMKERGDYSGPVLNTSAYTAVSLHSAWTTLIAVGAGLAVAQPATIRRRARINFPVEFRSCERLTGTRRREPGAKAPDRGLGARPQSPPTTTFRNLGIDRLPWPTIR